MKEGIKNFLNRVGMKKPMMKKKKMTQVQDNADDMKKGIKEGSKRDMMRDAKNGIMDKKKKMMPAKPQGKGIVKALGQKGTTGNFKRIEKASGKGAAIAALQNKLAARRGKPMPFMRKAGKK